MSSGRVITPAGDRFRVGVIGAGDDARTWRIPATQALSGVGVTVAAIADHDAARATTVAGALGIPEAYGSLERMLATTKLDGVIVALPPAEQEKAVLYALGRGLHVMCEAPFGSSRWEALKMLEAAKRARLVLATGYHRPLQEYWSLEHVKTSRGGRALQIEGSYLRSIGSGDGPASWDGLGWGPAADLASQLLSVVLRLPNEAPVAVSARSYHFGAQKPAGRGEDLIDMVVDFSHGARAHLVAGRAPHLIADELGIRFMRAKETVELPFVAHKQNPELFMPRVKRRGGDLWLGERPLSNWEAFVVQQGNWVRTCRREAESASRPIRAATLHAVLATAFASAVESGKRFELSPR